MKNFVKRVLLFSLFLVGIMLFSYMLNQLLFRKYVYQYPSEIKTIVSGDSRLRSSLDPEVIGECINISKQGMSYFVNFHVLRHLMDHNKNPDRVIVNFSPSHINEMTDKYFTDNPTAYHFFDVVYPALSTSDFKTMEINKKTYIKHFIKRKIVPNSHYLRKLLRDNGKYSYIGAFRTREKFVTDNKKCDYGHHFYDGEKLLGYSEISLTYLDSLAIYCGEKGVDLILVQSPLHDIYRSQIPNIFHDEFAVRKNELSAYDNVHFLDLQSFITSDSLFRDCHHMNKSGSQIVSKGVKEWIAVNASGK